MHQSSKFPDLVFEQLDAGTGMALIPSPFFLPLPKGKDDDFSKMDLHFIYLKLLFFLNMTCSAKSVIHCEILCMCVNTSNTRELLQNAL